jgi:ABC-type uncharacterized transport system ATPase subunit
LLDTRAAEERITEISEHYNLHVSPRKKVAELSVGEQQKVEIIKILFRNARILILDEPSAVLTPQEVEHLFSILERLKQQKHTIILITHKLREVKAISDRLTVLRQGKRIGTLETRAAEEITIAEMMIGRKVLIEIPESHAEKGAPVLETKSLVVTDARGAQKLHDVSLTIASGEILGIAGVEGNGQAELVASIIGLMHPNRGSILLKQRDITTLSIQERRRLGIAYIPEDRQRLGLVLDLSAGENLILGEHPREAFSRMWCLRRRAIHDFALNQMQHHDVRPADPRLSVRAFSGGNQQKLMLARELARDVSLLVAVHPTRGLDLAATQFTHQTLREKKSQGAATLLISADLSELIALSDRIAVLYGGKFIETLDARKTNEREIGLLMTGGKKASDAA